LIHPAVRDLSSVPTLEIEIPGFGVPFRPSITKTVSRKPSKASRDVPTREKSPVPADDAPAVEDPEEEVPAPMKGKGKEKAVEKPSRRG
jgi:hypothetical protein